MNVLNINSIGKIQKNDERTTVALDKIFAKALYGIEDFGQIYILWWADLFEESSFREMVSVKSPYIDGPATLGIFATRSPVRPNPIMISQAKIMNVDTQICELEIDYIDAKNGSLVIDLKPYYPFDRISNCKIPAWCEHWPDSYETSAMFPWHEEIVAGVDFDN